MTSYALNLEHKRDNDEMYMEVKYTADEVVDVYNWQVHKVHLKYTRIKMTNS